jgi:uncharacterized protein YjeT (DUF2065 family)
MTLPRLRGRGGREHCVLLNCPMTDFLAAIGLVFVIEGLIFAAFPAAAKRAVTVMTQTPDQGLRLVGLLSAALGLVMLWLVRG